MADAGDGGAVRVVKDITAGSVGGVAQVLVGQPFDTIKVRLQTQPTANPLYSGFVDCVKKTVTQEGPLALYKGTIPPLVGIGACVSIQFATVEAVKRYFQEGDKTRKLTYQQLYLCGAAAGVANAIVAIPVEHVRIRLQVQTNSGGQKAAYSGPIDCLKKIVSQHGLARGLFRGTLPTLLREFQGYGGYFMMYEWAVRQFAPVTKNASDLSLIQILACGSLAGFTFWIPTFQFDVIKSKMQADPFDKPKYKGMLDCVRQTYASDGLRGFYRGFTPCILRAIPANAATFLAFEMAMRVLGR